ncbi:MAG TPA: hypothetical protein VIM60_10370 [Edaphobacter sp.]
MAIKKYRYYFGPWGDVQLLPSVVRDAGVAPGPQFYGASSRSLTGSPSLLFYGARRQWNLTWPQNMTEDTARPMLRLEAAHRQRILRPYLFLDAKNTNYLPPDVSVLSSENNPIDLFTWGNGITSRVNTGVFHTELAGITDGYLTHTGVATSTFSCRFQLPVLAGSQYLFSGFFAGSGTIKLAFNFFNSSGVYISSVVGSNIVLAGTTTGTLQSMSMAAVSVPAGSTQFTVGYFEQTAGCVCNTNGWMVQYDEVARPANGFLPGAGGAQVVVEKIGWTYTTHKLRQYTALISEV